MKAESVARRSTTDLLRKTGLDDIDPESTDLEEIEYGDTNVDDLEYGALEEDDAFGEDDFVKFGPPREKFRNSLGLVRRAKAIARRGGRRRHRGHSKNRGWLRRKTDA